MVPPVGWRPGRVKWSSCLAQQALRALVAKTQIPEQSVINTQGDAPCPLLQQYCTLLHLGLPVHAAGHGTCASTPAAVRSSRLPLGDEVANSVKSKT